MKQPTAAPPLTCRIEIDYAVGAASARKGSEAIVDALLESGAEVRETRATQAMARGDAPVFRAGHPDQGDPWASRAALELSGSVDGGGGLEVFPTACRLRLHTRGAEDVLRRCFLALVGCGPVSRAVALEAGATAPPPLPGAGWLTYVPAGGPPLVGSWKQEREVPGGVVLVAYDLSSVRKSEELAALQNALLLRGPPSTAAIAETAPLPAQVHDVPAAGGRCHAPATGTPRTGSPPVLATEEIDIAILRQVMARGATPFSGTTAPERLAQLSASESAASASPATTQEDGDATMFLPRSAVLVEVASGVPGLSAPVTIPDLPVDRYAALCAELDVRGPSAEVLRRYEIATDLALKALHEEQARRFAVDPGLRSRFDERRAHFLIFLRTPR